MSNAEANTVALNLLTAINEMHRSTLALPSPTFHTMDEAAIDYLNAADFLINIGADMEAIAPFLTAAECFQDKASAAIAA